MNPNKWPQSRPYAARRLPLTFEQNSLLGKKGERRSQRLAHKQAHSYTLCKHDKNNILEPKLTIARTMNLPLYIEGETTAKKISGNKILKFGMFIYGTPNTLRSTTECECEIERPHLECNNTPLWRAALANLECAPPTIRHSTQTLTYKARIVQTDFTIEQSAPPENCE